MLLHLLLLGNEASHDLAVGLADAAGVLQVTRFAAGFGVFEKQDHGVVLPVFVLAADEAGELGFAGGGFGFEAFQFTL